MILFAFLIEKLNSWRSWRLGGLFFIPILCNAGNRLGFVNLRK